MSSTLNMLSEPAEFRKTQINLDLDEYCLWLFGIYEKEVVQSHQLNEEGVR